MVRSSTNLEPRVVFAHGKESGPWGRKIAHLADIAQRRGYRVESPDYATTDGPQTRLAQLRELAPTGSPLILVGSSMGGYISAMACGSLHPGALLLMAPALYMDGYPGDPEGCPAASVVVHGWHDDVVPLESSLCFARARCAALHVVDDGHRLADSVEFIGVIFARLLDRVRPRAPAP